MSETGNLSSETGNLSIEKVDTLSLLKEEKMILGGVGQILPENKENKIKNILTGDWKTIVGVQVNRPENYDLVSRDEAVALLEKAALSLRRVAGMKENLREKYDGLSEKCIDLVDKIKSGKMSVQDALEQLDKNEQVEGSEII